MKKLLAALISTALIAAPLSLVPTSASAQTAPSAQEGKVGVAAKSMAKAKPKAKAKAKAKAKKKTKKTAAKKSS